MGVIKEDSDVLDVQNLGSVVGPSVHFYGHDPSTSMWRGSVLIACREPMSSAAKLAYSTKSSDGQTYQAVTDVQPEVMASICGWQVIRFVLTVALQEQPQRILYVVSAHDATREGTIHVSARGSAWHVAGYSCNDQRQQKDVGTACWDSLKALHNSNPLHVLLGTGDQLYNDNVWDPAGSLSDWLKLDKPQMRTEPLTKEQDAGVQAFYFFAYLRWLCYHPLGPDGLAGIPQMNTWDDHDIFDGYGSYPNDLQESPAFRAIFAHAKRMFELFQMHTTPATRAADGYFSSEKGQGLSWVSQLGPNLAVAAFDTRSERSRDIIIPPEAIDELMRRVDALPDSVQHLIVVSAVPIAYPEITVLERFMMSLEHKRAWFQKTGLYNKLMNEFGEPELLDDIVDHWSSSVHKDEKARLLQALRDFSKRRTIRITLLSGDVHQCVVGYVASDPSASRIASDPGFMPQVISSAIGYNPPADAIVRFLDKHSGKPRLVAGEAGKPSAIWENVGTLFADKATRPSCSARFANCNNFVEFQVQTDVAGPLAGVPMLRSTLHVSGKEGGFTHHSITIPPLLHDPTPAVSQTLQDDMRRLQQKPESKLCGCFSC